MYIKRSIALSGLLVILQTAWPQAIAVRLRAAFRSLEADSSMKHAILSLYVEDALTGAVVFERNSQLGLAPASCQKLFTSGAALDLLGPDYRYRTELDYDREIKNGVLTGNLHIVGSGDPSLGSWRYGSTKDSLVLKRWMGAIERAGIRKISGRILADEDHFGTETIPGGWIWEDIGNYYGAGSSQLNWHENQYDLRLSAGDKIGDPASIPDSGQVSWLPWDWVNELTTAPPGSGDHANIYFSLYFPLAFVRGTIPLQREPFVISGAIPRPPRYAAVLLEEELKKSGKEVKGGKFDNEQIYSRPVPLTVIDSQFSPPLDSINYWFLRKSINLYGEALIRTLAWEQGRAGNAGNGAGIPVAGGAGPQGADGRGGTRDAATTEKGVEIVRDFWSQRGIDRSAIHIQDGSGLSPQNRVTTEALVRVLQYARKRPWWPSFYQALPLIDGIKMKSGAIGGVRSYAGYQRAADGKEYVFSIIVNNYDGPAGAVVKKMFALLDVLK